MAAGELDFKLLRPYRLHYRVRLGMVIMMVVTSLPATSPTASSRRSAPPALQRVAGRWGRQTYEGPLVSASGADLGALHRVHPAFSSAIFLKDLGNDFLENVKCFQKFITCSK